MQYIPNCYKFLVCDITRYRVFFDELLSRQRSNTIYTRFRYEQILDYYPILDIEIDNRYSNDTI